MKNDKNMVESTRVEASDARERVKTSTIIIAEANAFLSTTHNHEISSMYKNIINHVGKAIW